MFTLVLALVAFAGPNDRHWDQNRPDDPFWTNVAVPTARVSQRLQGRILGTVIQIGLSKEHADFLLGGSRLVSLLARGGGAQLFLYTRLGITILYRDNRVNDVGFSPFFQGFAK